MQRILVLVLLCVFRIYCHSWVEELRVVQNGQLLDPPGYARGYVPRTSPGFNDGTMTYLIPPDGSSSRVINPTDRICRVSQQTLNETANDPLLQAKAGDTIALRYQENGHITLPQNNPPGKQGVGILYVYGTASSAPTDTIAGIHMVWNVLGTGGDQRGRLLKARSFDDGKCFQVNNGAISKARQERFSHAPDPLQGRDLWCQIEAELPKNLRSGSIYTVFWVWDWSAYCSPTAPYFQIYTTCSDIYII